MTRTLRTNPAALAALMEAMGYTHGLLASSCDPPIQRSYVTNIIAGRRQPSPDVARRLAAALRVPLAAILADPDEAPSAAERVDA